MSGWSLIQATPVQAPASASQVQLSLVGVGAGHTLFLQLGYYDGSNNTSNPTNPPTDSQSNVWTRDQNRVNQHSSLNFYSAWNVAGGNTTVTVVKGSAATALQCNFSGVLSEWSGGPTSNSVDAGSLANATGSSTGPITCTTGILGNAGDLVFTQFNGLSGSDSGPAIPAGWTSLMGSTTIVSLFPEWALCYILPGSTSALSPSFGSFSTSAQWAAATAGYAPAGGGPSGSGNQALLLRGTT